MSNSALSTAKEGTLLHLRISPGAKRTLIEGPYGDRALKLRVAAPPVDGKANAEVERFLAALLEVPRSNVAVIRGASSRDKTVLLRGLAQPETEKALSPHLP